MPAREFFIQPPGYQMFLKMRVKRQTFDGAVIQMQVVIGDATDPISTTWCTVDAADCFQNKRDRATGLHRIQKIIF